MRHRRPSGSRRRPTRTRRTCTASTASCRTCRNSRRRSHATATRSWSARTPAVSGELGAGWAGREVVVSGFSRTSLEVVHAAIVSCERCPRLRDYCRQVAREKRRAFKDDVYWGKPVPGFGDPRARVLLVGLAPAAHGANRTGRVFTGDGVGGSGDFLMSALHRAGFATIPTSQHPHDGLKLRDAFVAAAVRCAPPDNKPTPEEVANCLPQLEAEMDALPRVP